MTTLFDPDSPYASHVPILLRFRPKRVLEFGPGLYSTTAFLAMPSLEKLVSVEHDPKWFERLKAEIKDPRWDLRWASEERPDPQDFDLVLIDDGDSAAQRLETIDYVLSRRHPRVVIHDAENPEYRKAIGLRSHIVYALTVPHTAVVAPW